jgi:hypothetical protein
MFGNKTGLMVTRIMQEMDKHNPEFDMELHRITHQ